jgi:dihydrofolate reductase
VLLGASTYRMFVEYWPTAENELVADAVNGTPKTVFSSTLDAAPWGRHAPARVVRGDAAEHVRRLRGEPGGDILLWGSISLAQALFAAGLVDEVHLNVVPVAVGAGRRLFADGQRLVLRETKAYASGIVSLRYGLTRG